MKFLMLVAIGALYLVHLVTAQAQYPERQTDVQRSSDPAMSTSCSEKLQKARGSTANNAMFVDSRGRCFLKGFNPQASLEQVANAALETCRMFGTGDCRLFAINGELSSDDSPTYPHDEEPAGPSTAQVIANALNQAVGIAQDYRAQQQQIRSGQQAQRDAFALQRQQQIEAQRSQALVEQQQSYQQLVQRKQQLAAQQQAANSAQTQSVQNGDPRTNSSARLSVQYHPSFTDQGVVEVDRNKTLDGIPGSVSDYIVRVTNTGDVRLFCDASASALTASGSGASCTGKRIEDCTNGQQFNTSDTAYVSPGNTADVVTIRYYLRNGTYQLGCHAEP